MAGQFFNWSQTAASNATADSTVNFAEGQAPSTLNDSNRAAMASIASFRDDISGAITTGGTSTAYTVTTAQAFTLLTQLNGQMIAFTPHTTNGATVTLAVNGGAAKPLRSAPSVELPSGVLVQGTPYVALYNNSDAAWYLHGFYSNPYQIPIGASVDFWGATAPNSAFALMYGQAISRTTYATLFSLFSTTFGTGDGSTTFNIPDLRGRVVAGKDDMGGSAASRLSSATITSGATTLGNVSAATETKTILTANLPAYTPTGTITNGAISFPNALNTSNVNGTSGAVSTGSGGVTANLSTIFGVSQATSTFTGTAQGGTSTAFSIVQPTIIGNKLLRLI